MERHREPNANLLATLRDESGGSQGGSPPTVTHIDDLQQQLLDLQHQLQEWSLPQAPIPSLSRPSSPCKARDVDNPCTPRSRHTTVEPPVRTRSRAKSSSWERKEILRLQKVLAKEREETKKLRTLRGATEQKVATRISKVEALAKSLLADTERLERRRLADTEGWRAELSLLRRRLDAAERRQRRLSILGRDIPDDDYREVVLDRHRNVKRDALGRVQGEDSELEDENDLPRCLAAVAEELRSLQLALGGLEERFVGS